jgi:hypothetical protein
MTSRPSGKPASKRQAAEDRDPPDKNSGKPRVPRDITLLYLSLDLWPGPYAQIAAQMPEKPDDG